MRTGSYKGVCPFMLFFYKGTNMSKFFTTLFADDHADIFQDRSGLDYEPDLDMSFEDMTKEHDEMFSDAELSEIMSACKLVDLSDLLSIVDDIN